MTDLQRIKTAEEWVAKHYGDSQWSGYERTIALHSFLAGFNRGEKEA